MENFNHNNRAQFAAEQRARHFRLMNNLANPRRQQQVPSPPPKLSQASTGSAPSQQSSGSSQSRILNGNHGSSGGGGEKLAASIDTPCRQIAELKLKQTDQTKPRLSAKLLGAKSLSQLMSANFNLFSKRPKAVSPNSKRIRALAQKLEKPANSKPSKDAKLSACKSFPSGTSYRQSQLVDEIMQFTNEMAVQQAATSGACDVSFNDQFASEPVPSRVDSASLVAFPRQSTANPLGYSADLSASMVSSTNLSPIPMQSSFLASSASSSSSAQSRRMQHVVGLTPTIRINPLKVINGEAADLSAEQNSANGTSAADQTKQKTNKTKSNKYKPFKNTALVLRDVKNSISLRMKAKQESQAFERLTNEICTPPTKLYSPFNIYTPGGEISDATAAGVKQQPLGNKKEFKARKRLNLGKSTANRPAGSKRTVVSNQPDDSGNGSLEESANNSSAFSDMSTPKGRIALQHKKHLLNANKFSFNSPTGRLRETVKDVEQFQQCIEDISKAIRARGEDQILF